MAGVFLAGYVRWRRVRLYAELAPDHSDDRAGGGATNMAGSMPSKVKLDSVALKLASSKRFGNQITFSATLSPDGGQTG